MASPWMRQEASQTPQPSQFESEGQTSSRDRKKKQQQPRQLLSCTKCRERKVKACFEAGYVEDLAILTCEQCDRTKPCSACCARGLPKECHFVLGEGAEFGPIQQSLELRKLRIENQRLKERLLAAKVPLLDESDDDDESSSGRPGPSNRRATKQKRFRTNEQTDSLYFGSPGLASVIADFANFQVEPKSISHTLPRGVDMYAAHRLMYPFPALWTATCPPSELLQILQPHEDLFAFIDSFTRKGQGFVFPYLPEELTKKEVQQFLQDAEQNANKHPDYLALIFAASALGEQLTSREGGPKQGETQPHSRKGGVFVAATMHALRSSSFMSQPTLTSIQALLMLSPYLTNSGRFLDAWSLFGTTIRLAHSIGLHRNPRYLNPIPPLRECTVRSTLWWWMLHLDQQYSMTLGRPLGISGLGDCPPPEPLTTNPAVLRLGEFVDQLTIWARQILGSNHLSDTKIDMFTDRLIALWDTMPEALQFNESWIHQATQIPEWPLDAMAAMHYCKVHNYIILLNRQRLESPRNSSEYNTPSPKPMQPNLFDTQRTFQPDPESASTKPPPMPRGRPLVIRSSIALLDAFIFFYKRVPMALLDWNGGQQAFNASMILLLDGFETGNLRNISKVEQAFAIFVELEKNHLHQLAALAVSRISEGLLRLRDIVEGNELAVPLDPGESGAGAGRQLSVSQTQHMPFDWTTEGRGAQLPKYYAESVMSSTGMFLLEDHGLQAQQEQSFPSALAAAAPPPLASNIPTLVPRSVSQSRTASQSRVAVGPAYGGRTASFPGAACFDPMDPRRDSGYGPVMQVSQGQHQHQQHQQQRQQQPQFFVHGHPLQQQQQQLDPGNWGAMNPPQLAQRQVPQRRKASHQGRRGG